MGQGGGSGGTAAVSRAVPRRPFAARAGRWLAAGLVAGALASVAACGPVPTAPPPGAGEPADDLPAGPLFRDVTAESGVRAVCRNGEEANSLHPDGVAGLIAEEVAEVSPDAAIFEGQTRDGLPIGVDNERMIAYLVDAVQYLRQRLEDGKKVA